MDILPTRDQVPEIVRTQAIGARPHAPGGRPSAGAGISGQDVFRILRKRKWMILLIAGSVLGVVFAGTLVWRIYAPLYSATAHLNVNPPANNLIANTGLASRDVMERLMKSHAAVAKSDPVLVMALDDRLIQDTKWYKQDRVNALRRLYLDIDVAPVPGTSYIAISMTAQAPTDEEKGQLADIVNAVARAFEAVQQKNLAQGRTGDIEALGGQIDRLKADLERVRNQANAERRNTDVSSLQKRRGVLDIQLQQLTQELLRLQMFKAQADASLAALAEQEADGSIAASPEVLRALEMDPVLNMLRNTELQLQLQRENEDQKFGSEHRSVKATETRLTAVKAELVAREKMLTQRALDLIRSDRRATAASITAQMLDVQQRFDEVNAGLRDLEQNLTRIEQFALEEDSLDKRIRRYEDQLVDLRLLAQRERQVELWIPATKPREIDMPKWTIMIPLGAILGIALGLGLAFLLEFVDASIKSPSDISRRVDLPLLGMIPHTDDLDDKIEDMRLAFMTHPNSLVSEAFRQIRTCLLFSGPSSQRRSLLVTSPLPEDGRTTVALNLAGSIAQGGRKVLVVDANFRQPAIRKLFPRCPEGGLSNALVGQANWKDLVYDVQPNLQVMPAGMLPPNPADLLGSDEMRRLIAELCEQYDEVIIDGAPCLVVTDSVVLSTLVDGVVLTVRAGSNTHGVVQRTRDILFRVGAHIVGVALNGVRATAGGYLRKNYETFNEYHAQAQLPAK